MRLLVLTTLFPNAAMPNHGVFVENRLRAVLNHKSCDVKVIAPVPWFPFKAGIFGAYGRFAAAPLREIRHDIEVLHPRYVIPPKIGMTYAVYALRCCVITQIRKLRKEGWDFDLIDAHYFYPDGVVASDIARATNRPVIITARGSDISQLPDFPRQRRMILKAASSSFHNIAVCTDLKDKMVNLGAQAEKISVLRNGVDLEIFKIRDCKSIRARYNLAGQVLVCVGHLIARKGQGMLLAALARLDGVTLLIIGDGPDKTFLETRAQQLGLSERVRFLGSVPHEDLSTIYSAADALVLGSSREGWPNVLLEAMACGTPVIAPPVGGCPEIVTAPEAGRIADSRSPADFARAIADLLQNLPCRQATRRYAENFSWDQTARGVWYVFDAALSQHAPLPIRPPTGFVPLGRRPSGPLKLLVTVDTEEIFDWSNNEFLDNSVPPPSDLIPFDEMCHAADVVPLHFVTLPLLEDPDFAAHCQKRARAQQADFGIQMHQWVIPPIATKLSPQQSYQCNLPPALHRAKLVHLINAFTAVFGHPPLCHRAGRYGVSYSVFEDLIAHGIQYDFSAAASRDFSGDGGPDYSALTAHPLVTYRDDIPFFTTPVSAARAIRKFEYFIPQPRARAGQFRPLSRLLKAVTSSAGLTPEGRTLSEMKSITNRLTRDNVGLVTLSVHSTSLHPGATPYCETMQDVNDLIDKTHAYLSWFKKQGGEIVTFTHFTEYLKYCAPEKGDV